MQQSDSSYRIMSLSCSTSVFPALSFNPALSNQGVYVAWYLLHVCMCVRAFPQSARFNPVALLPLDPVTGTRPQLLYLSRTNFAWFCAAVTLAEVGAKQARTCCSTALL